MATQESLDLAQTLYVAYYGRPADRAGLNYWADEIDANGVDAMVNAFGNSAEFEARFGNLSNEQLINNLYQQMFGRSAELAGLDFYSAQLANGESTLAEIALDIANGAQNEDATALSNKVAVAANFTAAIDTTEEVLAYAGDSAANSARDFLATVNAETDAETVDVDAQLSSLVQADQDETTAGETFTLTAGTDNLTGTANNDTFTASALADSAGGGALVDSLQSVDLLDGGAGSDTLNATLNGGTTVTPSLSNIENIQLRSTKDAANLSLSSSTGVEKVTVSQSTGTSTVSGLGTIGSLNVADQSKGVTFSGSTATSLTLGVSGVSKAVTVDLDDAKATSLALNLSSLGNKAADGTITNVTLDQNAATATAVTAELTGSNYVNFNTVLNAAKSLTVDGAGSLTAAVANTNIGALETLTVSEGASVDVDAVVAGALKTVAAAGTTGAVAVQVDDTATAVATGSGNDTVTYTAAIAANANVNLGAGDDTLTVTGADKTATINAGAGTDILAGTNTNIVNLVGDADKAARFSNFETLKVTNELANNNAIDVSKISGVGNFVAGDGVAAGGTATISGLGANANVEIAGSQNAVVQQEVQTLTFSGTTRTDGNITVGGVTVAVLNTDTPAQTATKVAAALNGQTLTSPASTGNVTATATGDVVQVTFPNTAGDVSPITVADGTSIITGTVAVAESTKGSLAAGGGTLNLAMATDTSADVANLKLNLNYTENNDATSTVTALTSTVDASKVETLNVESTGKASATFTGTTGNKADGLINTLTLTDDALVTLNVTGDQAFSFTSAANMTKLATVNASALDTATGTGATINVSNAKTDGTAAAITVTGSADNDMITGSGNADTISGGAGNDTITGGAKGDMLSGGEGNDTFVFAAGDSSIGTGAFDTITGFSANTFGSGTNGAAADGNTAAIDSTKWTGDVLRFGADTQGSAAGVKADVLGSAADASTFLSNNAGSAEGLVAALDSSTGNLYVDNTNDGVADFFIQLQGVTTIDEAAFVLV